MTWISSLWADGWISSMFTLPIPAIEKILRPVIVYAFLVFLLRIFGKRELARLNPFDLVVLLSLSNTVQNAIIGDDNSLVGGLIGAVALCSINYVVVRFLFRRRRLDQIIAGRRTVLIKNGEILKENLARELITPSELTMIAHRQGFKSLKDVKSCELEPGGTFAIEGMDPAPAKAKASGSDGREAELAARLEEVVARLESLERRLSAAQANSSGSGTP